MNQQELEYKKIDNLNDDELVEYIINLKNELERRHDEMAMPNRNNWDNLGESSQVNTAEYPTCPTCLTNYEVYCMECQNHSVNCTCATTEFYCHTCKHDFSWGFGGHYDTDDLIEDMDEILDIQILDDLETDGESCGNCGRKEGHFCNVGEVIIHWDGENYVSARRYCPNCGDYEDHECKTPDGSIIAWNRAKGIVDQITCVCTPQKHYICPICEVERETKDSPWERRTIGQLARTAERVGAVIKGVNEQIIQMAKEKQPEEPTCYCPEPPAYFCGKCRVTRTSPSSKWTETHGYAEALEQRRKDREQQVKDGSLVPVNRVLADECVRCHRKRGEFHEASCYFSGAVKVGTAPKYPTNVQATKSTPVPYSNTGSSSPVVSTSKSKYDSSSWDYDDYDWAGGMWQKCRHYGETVRLPNGVDVNCSSLWDTRKDESDYPQRGLYFDWMWKPEWRAEHIHWPDFGIPSNMVAAAEAIRDHYELAKKGILVELGCIGGHGRTGTALACMVIMAVLEKENLDPNLKTDALAKLAGDWVKEKYCKEAIESQIQWWYLKWFYAWYTGKPLPAKPEPQPITKWSSSSGYCTVNEHYLQWLANPKSTKCTKRRHECNLYNTDKLKFESGQVEQYVVKNALDIKQASDFNNIDGYKVPKAKIGDRTHNRNDAGCTCDYCRYRARGGIAFLEKVAVTEVYLKTPSGIIRTDVTPEFEPQPPSIDGLEQGHRIGDYIWMNHLGQDRWVWDAVKRAKSKYIRQNQERNKERKEARKKAASDRSTVPHTTPGGVKIESLGSGSLKVKDLVAAGQKTLDFDGDDEYDPPGQNKRNKKNPNRKGGRRRSGKRRR